MAFNIHSDHLLQKLREPGEATYKIPTGGLFEYVSAANYFGEIVEWFGYSIATWTFPAFAFAIFSALYLGSRALQHHRFYVEKFQEYPKSRKALIPFLF
ncbi:3-oxo-5-alpha-steroid 4-dehydrogenase 2-like [Cetorhinus maximus]